MEKIKQVLSFMGTVCALKSTDRVGWNMEPGPGQLFVPRRVKGAEKVASHTYSVCMLWHSLSEYFPSLDSGKMFMLLLLHDLCEAVTGDMVTATVTDKEQRRQLLADKNLRETMAMQSISSQLSPEVGSKSLSLWLEYENQTSPEAKMAKQLDKLEAVIQAVFYWEQGQELDPQEFIDEVKRHLSDRILFSILDALQERVDAPLALARMQS